MKTVSKVALLIASVVTIIVGFSIANTALEFLMHSSIESDKCNAAIIGFIGFSMIITSINTLMCKRGL